MILLERMSCRVNLKSRLSVQVAYRSHGSGLSSGIESGQANFYLAESGAG